MSASNLAKLAKRNAVAFIQQLTKVDTIEHMPPKIPWPMKGSWQKPLAWNSGNNDVPRSSQLAYTVLGHQPRETDQLGFQLLPKAKRVWVPKYRWVTARTTSAEEQIRIPHNWAISSLKEYVWYFELLYPRASPIILGKVDRPVPPMVMNGGSEICMMSEEVARELNIEWKCTDQKIITADGK